MNATTNTFTTGTAHDEHARLIAGGEEYCGLDDTEGAWTWLASVGGIRARGYQGAAEKTVRDLGLVPVAWSAWEDCGYIRAALFQTADGQIWRLYVDRLHFPFYEVVVDAEAATETTEAATETAEAATETTDTNAEPVAETAAESAAEPESELARRMDAAAKIVRAAFDTMALVNRVSYDAGYMLGAARAVVATEMLGRAFYPIETAIADGDDCAAADMLRGAANTACWLLLGLVPDTFAEAAPNGFDGLGVDPREVEYIGAALTEEARRRLDRIGAERIAG